MIFFSLCLVKSLKHMSDLLCMLVFFSPLSFWLRKKLSILTKTGYQKMYYYYYYLLSMYTALFTFAFCSPLRSISSTYFCLEVSPPASLGGSSYICHCPFCHFWVALGYSRTSLCYRDNTQKKNKKL